MESIEGQERLANDLVGEVIGAAIEVHKQLGPGLLESAYQACMRHELSLKGIPYEHEVPLPVEYKGLRLECSYRLDLLIRNLIIVELKSVDKFEPVHSAQLLTYLRLSKIWLGLLINFNVPVLKDGLKRVVYG